MVYASNGNMKCFECGDVGHKRAACPQKNAEKQQVNRNAETPQTAGALLTAREGPCLQSAV